MEAASENVDRLAMIAVSGIIFAIALKILNPRRMISFSGVLFIMSLDGAARKSGTKIHSLCGCASIVILQKGSSKRDDSPDDTCIVKRCGNSDRLQKTA